MTPSLSLAGGAACFGTPPTSWIDCLSWGSFADGAGNATVFGTNFRPTTGLTQGQAVVCDETRGLNLFSLDANDCIDSADDHVCGDAQPLANPVGSTAGFLAANPACIVPQYILGKLMLVKDPQPGVDATRRKIVLKGKETLSSNSLTGDPITGGATLEIILRGTSPSSQTFVLPPGAALWRALGSTGYRYKDAAQVNGPIKSLVFTKSTSGMFVITVIANGSGSPLNLAPPNPGTEARARFIPGSGGDSYCVTFRGDAGGTIAANTAQVFRLTNAFTEGLCPP